MPETTSRNFAYADIRALIIRQTSINTTAHTLSNDILRVREFRQKWKLIPNPSKIVSTYFHLSNHQANQQLDKYFVGTIFRYNRTINGTPTFCQHLNNTAAKVHTRNNIIQKLCGISWEATSTILYSGSCL